MRFQYGLQRCEASAVGADMDDVRLRGSDRQVVVRSHQAHQVLSLVESFMAKQLEYELP